jgi:TolB protein
VFEAIRAPPALEPQLFVMRADGSEALQVSRASSFHSPAWSPDGRSIAFRRRVSVDGTNGELNTASEVGLMSPDGTEQVTLVADESRPDNVLPFRTFDGPTWSPDGRSLAFASKRDSPDWAVWTMSRSGAQQRRLMPDLDQPHYNPSWARHDASKLAFVANIEGVQDVWLVDVLQPTQRQNLTLDLAERILNPDSPAWSPDGKRLAFSAQARGGGDDHEIYVLDLSTRELARLTDNDAEDVTPAWSPDGTSLLLCSNRVWLTTEAPGSLVSRFLDLFSLPLEGAEEPRRLTVTGFSAEPDWYGSSSCSDAP